MKQFLIAVLMALGLSGCATIEKYNPVGAAETYSQKAFAVYGMFTVATEAAAEAYNHPATGADTKKALQEAVDFAEPFVIALFHAAKLVEDTIKAAEDGEATPAELQAAGDAFEQVFAEAMRAVRTIGRIAGSAGKEEV